DILKVDWIFVHGRQEYWQVVTSALGVDMDDHDKGLTTNASNIALELAAMGAGLVATQRSLAHAYLRRGLLVEPFPVRPASPWNYYLTENQLSKGTIARTVREWIPLRAQEDGA
ncbi:LysR family transcriptional regulator, partial [Mesorhizobium sp. M7A.F.Ca.CA.001.10.2.1]